MTKVEFVGKDGKNKTVYLTHAQINEMINNPNKITEYAKEAQNGSTENN